MPAEEEPGTPAHDGLTGFQIEVAQDLRRQAWLWALTERAADGTLPSGRRIVYQFGRHERWGDLSSAQACWASLALTSHPTCATSRSAERWPGRSR